jgi:drug/metabolite transporter (DMT)-like permease
MSPLGAPVSGLTGVGLAVLAAGGLAIQALAVSVGTTDRRVGDVLAVVFAVNLLVIVPLAVFTTRPPYGLTPSAIGAFAVAGILGSLLGRACYYVGIARLGASRAEPLRALLPLFAVGTAVIVLDEPITPLVLGGVLLLVVGGAAVAAEAHTSPVTADGAGLRLDIAFPLAAALFYGIDPVVTKLGFVDGATAMAGLAVRTAAGVAGFGTYLAWRTAREGRRPSVSVDRWTVVAGLGNTGYLLAYYAALARAPVVVVTPVMSLSTLFVVVGAAALLREKEGVTRRLVGAAMLVVSGALIVVRG